MKKSVPKQSKTIERKSNLKKIFVVGIGASAGGLEALKQFFDNTPANSGMAFIIVQHLDPTHKSLLSGLIAGHTKMKVSEITNGVKVKPNCVYIIPPNKDLKISHGALQLTEPTETRPIRRPIDSFFQSLAIDQKEKAIGIVLSGTGTEGTLGLKEIKFEGGITIVQDPKTAQFDGMPQSAINARTADFILPPEKIPAQLIRLIKKTNKLELIPELVEPLETQLRKIFLIIRNQTGYDFSNYKTNTIIRRIAKRTAFNQIESIDDYIIFLQNNPLEVDLLYKDFLIGVTSFFRDADVFTSLETKAIPYLLEKCKDKQEIRIWVCGCSTGEEAYSLAIMFREALKKNKNYIKVTLFASDIDKDAIETARSGIYSESSVADISPEFLSQYFVKKERGYQLIKEIREMVVFAHHNVIKDPPFSKMDLITCRNLLIYMNGELQKQIIPVFHYGLNKEGLLLLGTSESIGDYSDLFTAFEPKAKIYIKNGVNALQKPKRNYEFPSIPARNIVPVSTPPFAGRKKTNVSNLSSKILLENYAPPSVIIDKNNDALYFSGNTGQYLEPPSGEATLNILEMAKKGLKIELENAIREARNRKREVQIPHVEVKVGLHFETIKLIIKPVLSKESDLGALMIIFEKTETPKHNNLDKTAHKKLKISELEKELNLTREHLQTAINELEISKEDFQTTNEEYQSTNEELQSTNEELETSREELQSVNEELITVNSELSGKIEQLSQANDDLNNLLSSIEVATIYLDRNLKVKRFTPTATKIFNLIPSDIDRPVTHLSSNIVYEALVDDVKNALRTLAVKSADVLAMDGTWYHMRILPYRTTENVIEGVLVTFVDITEIKKTEETLKKTNEHLNIIMENLPAIPFTCVANPEISISFVGKSCEKVTGFLPEQFINSSSFWLNRIHKDDKKKIETAFKNIAKKISSDLPFRWKCADGKYKSFINYIRFAPAENSRPAYIVGIWQEVTGNYKHIQ